VKKISIDKVEAERKKGFCQRHFRKALVGIIVLFFVVPMFFGKQEREQARREAQEMRQAFQNQRARY